MTPRHEHASTGLRRIVVTAAAASLAVIGWLAWPAIVALAQLVGNLALAFVVVVTLSLPIGGA